MNDRKAALRDLGAWLARQAGTVVPGRIVREPRGTPCLGLDPCRPSGRARL